MDTAVPPSGKAASVSAGRIIPWCCRYGFSPFVVQAPQRASGIKVLSRTIRYGMPFECSQCGECCSHLGLVHIIEKDYGGFRFLLRNQYTGERVEVAVDPDKIALYSDAGVFSERPEACPFFRFDRGSGKGYCTVHRTRPEICREYGCWRLLILDSDGKRVGRIMEQRHLASEDEALTRLFEEQINRLTGLEDEVWDRQVIGVLVAAGYTVRV